MTYVLYGQGTANGANGGGGNSRNTSNAELGAYLTKALGQLELNSRRWNFNILHFDRCD